ncbi:MAG: hypothetical protein H2015_03370 [Chloroflexi bacterium]|nr:hypothetical protein [Chloroflexota bacterium]|tara:strand:- start:913 stop:1149 length:237 start_codon:yes stop_codon:yes gene_type:complete
MVTNELSEKIKIYILRILNKQFMYPDEIIENCIEEFGTQINTLNPSLTIRNQLKILSDNKMVAYYHGYKITPKGRNEI